MSCNTFIPIMDLVREVEALLAANYIDKDDPRITGGVFTSPTIKGDLILDSDARAIFCEIVQQCGLKAPEGKMWMPRPLYPENIAVSYDDAGEVRVKWTKISDLIPPTDFTYVESFEMGGELTRRDQALVLAAAGEAYRWAGDLPKIVPPGSTPESSGGVSSSAWVRVPNKMAVTEVHVDSVAAMVAATSAEEGDVFVTTSYHKGTGVGGNSYQIKAKASLVADGGSIIAMDNGLVAVATFPGDVATLKQFGAIEGTDATAQISALAAYSYSNRQQVNAQGSYNITAPLDIDISYSNIRFALVLTTTNKSEIGLSIKHRAANSTGKITVICGDQRVDVASYYARRQEVGVRIYDARASTVCNISAVGARRNGIEFLSGGVGFGNSNMATIGYLNSTFSGTFPGHIKSTPTEVVNQGAATSLSQTSTLTFSNIPSELRPADFIRTDGVLYLIRAVSTTDKTVTVFPHLPSTIPQEVEFVIGCGIRMVGTDSNVAGVECIDSVNGSIGAKLDTFYGPNVGRVHVGTGYAGVAVMSGDSPFSSNLGGVIGYLYTESLPIDILQTTIGATNWRVLSGLRTIISKTIAPRNIPSSIDTQQKSTSDVVQFRGVTIGGSAGVPGVEESYIAINPLSSGYILLAEKKAGGNTFSGEVYVRGPSTSSVGQTAAHVFVDIAQTKAAAASVLLESTTTAPIQMCTVIYEGIAWYALDVTQLTGISVGYFKGVQDSTSSRLKSVGVGDVSAVSPITYSSTQYKYAGLLRMRLDGKGIDLRSPDGSSHTLGVNNDGTLASKVAVSDIVIKSPNGTSYTLSVDDEGVLTAQPAPIV